MFPSPLLFCTDGVDAVQGEKGNNSSIIGRRRRRRNRRPLRHTAHRNMYEQRANVPLSGDSKQNAEAEDDGHYSLQHSGNEGSF